MTTRYSFSTRPVAHPERATCLDFADALPATLHAVIAATLAEVFRPAASGYTAARAANEAASARVAGCSDRVWSATATFDEGFDRWTVSIDHQNRKGFAAAELPPELGHQSPSVFLKSPARDKVDRMTTLLVHVEETPSLTGDPAAQKALREATEALREAVGAHEASLRERALAARALTEASRAFDKAWGLLVKDLIRYDPDGQGARVPRFARKKPAEKDSDAEGEAASAPPAVEAVPATEVAPADGEASEALPLAAQAPASEAA